jgi:GNAT superfamily N-acetyltransferase
MTVHVPAVTNDTGWATLETSSGLLLRVRPEQPGDGPTLVELFSRLSPSSRFLRFSKVMDAPDPQRVQREAERLARLGPPADMAWLAFADLPEMKGAPVAAVRYVRTGPGEAELAVAVLDDVQRQGIGAALLLFACTQAQQDGIERLTAIFRSENRGIWSLLKRSPFPVSWTVDGPEISAVVDLTSDGTD